MSIFDILLYYQHVALAFCLTIYIIKFFREEVNRNE